LRKEQNALKASLPKLPLAITFRRRRA
jgi:hypothetical protein